MVKTLDFMGLKYEDLYSKTLQSKTMRETLYKEKSNVFSYYVAKCILMSNYQDFLLWSKKNNNFSLMQFNKTPINKKKFCKFIEKHYKSSKMLQNVKSTEEFLNKMHSLIKNNNSRQSVDYLLTNMRMSICELG
jgi:hypothetical protein